MSLDVSSGLPSCYPAYQLFCLAVKSTPEERANLITRVDQALREQGFNPKGNFLPIHDAEGDDFCSQPLRALSSTPIVILQAGQYLAKHEPPDEQRQREKVAGLTKNVCRIWEENMKRLGLESVRLIPGLEIGRPGRGEFSEDIAPFSLTEEDEQSIKNIVEYLKSQEDKSVKILINAPGYTLAKLIENYADLLKQKIKTIYMSGFASVNTTDGMTSVIKLIGLAQSDGAEIEVIIRDGTIFRTAEDLNFLFIQALKKLSTECGSSFASAELQMINEWKQFDSSSRQVRAAAGRDVSEATAAREARLEKIKMRVEEVTGIKVFNEEQTVLSDLFMWIIAYTDKERLITEDYDKVTVKREFKPRSREREIELQSSALEKEGIYKVVKDLKFDKPILKFDNLEIPLDKDSYLALSIFFTLLKRVQSEKTVALSEVMK